MLRFLKNSLHGFLSLGFLALLTNAYAVGLMPTPVLNNAKISSIVSFDQPNRRYNYVYAVTNPTGNSGEIWHFTIDVSYTAENGMKDQTYGLTIPFGIPIDFSAMLSELVSMNNARSIPTPMQAGTIVPFGQIVPQGWAGALGLDSYAHFISGDNAPNIMPGTSLGGFQLISYGVPTIRKAQIIPLWMHIVDDHDAVPDADRVEAGKIEQDIIFNTLTLGPSGVSYGSYAHWNQLRDDLARAIQLGWINDPVLANNLTAQLASARQALDAKDGALAKTWLQALINTINQSTPAQRGSEAFGLVLLNAQALLQNTPSTPIRFEPKLTLSPKSAQLPIGQTHTLTATAINIANNDAPISGSNLSFSVAVGPDAGMQLNATTDGNGQAVFSFVGMHLGTDQMTVSMPGTPVARNTPYAQIAANTDDIAPFLVALVVIPPISAQAQVTWSGGPDLVVPFFSPPLLITKGGKKFYMSEETLNIGNVTTPPSVTRYYIAAAPILDVTTAQVIGERSIPALQPGKSDQINQRVFHMPRNFLAGTYYLAACADANNAIVELNENNNCSFSKIEGYQSFIEPMKKIKGAHEKDEDDDEDEDEEHHDDRDGSKGTHDLFKNPFGKAEDKR